MSDAVVHPRVPAGKPRATVCATACMPPASDRICEGVTLINGRVTARKTTYAPAKEPGASTRGPYVCVMRLTLWTLVQLGYAAPALTWVRPPGCIWLALLYMPPPPAPPRRPWMSPPRGGPCCGGAMGPCLRCTQAANSDSDACRDATSLSQSTPSEALCCGAP